MAEALTLIGGLAAILQLTGVVVKLTKDLRVCVRTVRSAPKDIEYFILEASIFTDQLCYFHDLAKESANTMSEKFNSQRAELVRKILRQCKSVKRGFARLVRRFLEINGADAAPVNTLWARMLWLWKKPDVPELRLSLQSATANVTLLCTLFTFEELRRKNANDERLEMLQERLRNWVSTARRLRRELAEYQKRKSPSESTSETAAEESYDKIAEDTRELERCVVKAIRSHVQEVSLAKSTRPPRRGPPAPAARRTRAASSEPDSIIEISPHESATRAGQPISRKPSNERVEERSPSRGRRASSSLTTASEEIYEIPLSDGARDRDNVTYMHIGERPAEDIGPDVGVDDVVEIVDPGEPRQVVDRPQSEEEEVHSEGILEVSPKDSELPKLNPSELSRIPSCSYLDGQSERGAPSIHIRNSSASESGGSETSHATWNEADRGSYGRRRPRRPRGPRAGSPVS